MRTAIISDIHGNYPALEQVLTDAHKNNAERFIFIGDYIFDLPFSNEVVLAIRKIPNAHIITGNKEVYLKRLRTEDQNNWTFKQMGAIYQTYREMPSETVNYLTGLKESSLIPFNSDKYIYAAHYLKGIGQRTKSTCGSSMFHKKMLNKTFSHQEYLTEFSEMLKQDEWHNAIREIDASVILFGHTHLQGYGYCDGKLIINPGSCGQPLDFNPNASYTILEETNGKFKVIERRVEYDIDLTISKAKSSNIYSHAEIWCELCFLALRTGKDYFGNFFEIADRIADSKDERGHFYSNETWEEAYDIFACGNGEVLQNCTV